MLLRAVISWFGHAIVLFRIAGRLVSGYLLIQCGWPFMDRAAREASVQRWCRSVLRVLGMAIETSGRPFPGPQREGLLLVCNHVSWVDTIAIHALVPCGFLAKESLRGWPIIGHLIARTGGVFVQRGHPFDLQRALDAIEASVAEGRSICVFPEGTTTDGTSVGDFSTLVFEVASRRGVGVLPLGIRYRHHGVPTQLPAWVGDEAFLPSLLRIAANDGLAVQIIVGEPLPQAPDRATGAEQARLAVAALAGVPLAVDAVAIPPEAVPGLEEAMTPQVTRIVDAVREWIAKEREMAVPQVGDRASLRSLGIDSLAIVRLVTELEDRLELRVDESKLELSSFATVRELGAAMARSGR